MPFAPINPHTSFSFGLAQEFIAIGIPAARPTPAVAKADVFINFLLFVII